MSEEWSRHVRGECACGRQRWMQLLLLSLAASACQFPGYFVLPDADHEGGSSTSGGAGAATSGGVGAARAAQGGTTSDAGSGSGGVNPGAGTSMITGGSGGATAGSAGAAGQAGAGNDPGLLFFDDFESGIDSKWQTVSGAPWSFIDDTTRNGKVYQQNPLFAEMYAAVAKAGPFSDQVIEAEVKVLRFGDSAAVVSLYGRFSSAENYYAATLRLDGRAGIRAAVAGSVPTTIKTSANFGVTTGVWYHLRFELVGSDLKLFVDGSLRAEVTDTRVPQGTVAIGGTDSAAMFDDVRVTKP